MYEFKTKITEIINRAENVKSFRLKKPNDVTFSPGQWFFLEINTPKGLLKKPFSFSSSPTEKFLEFTKRLTQSDLSKYLCNDAKVGDEVFIRMPLGNLTFSGEYTKIALLSGGIGITPFKSIIKYATDKKLSSDIILFYSSRDEENIIFKDELNEMEKNNSNFHVIHTLTDENTCPPNWSGNKGFICDESIKRYIPDYKERMFYVCGPPKMVTSLVEILREKLAIKEEMIKVENFTGY